MFGFLIRRVGPARFERRPTTLNVDGSGGRLSKVAGLSESGEPAHTFLRGTLVVKVSCGLIALVVFIVDSLDSESPASLTYVLTAPGMRGEETAAK